MAGPRSLALLCFLASCAAFAVRTTDARGPGREDLGVSIGNGGGISIGIGGSGWPAPLPPPPKPKPKPKPWEPRRCDFENERLYRAYLVIQKFKETVSCDPQNIASTWTGTDICGNSSYKGFYCDRPYKVNDRTVASVDFNGYMLQADSVQGFVDGLPDLALFHANSNNFGGAVPSLKSLQYFYELDLSNNKLAPAAFPAEVLAIRNATFIDIRFNSFYGELPAALFSSFPAVEAIFVNNNRFSGPLPGNLGDSPVKYLSLANNEFTGPIPASISRAGDTLLEVLFLNNRLSGCIPYELGLLGKATVIDAGANMLTGTIPASYACLRSVEQLSLADNLLYGVVPDALCRLASSSGGGRLANLTLSGNYFTWLGSCCWDLIGEGKLNVDRNCIPFAPNQRSHEECARFFFRKIESHATCPISAHAPCRSSSGWGYDAAEQADAAAEESKYRTYSALRP